MALPLLAIGALLAFAMAGRAKAQAVTAKPVTSRKKRITISKVTPKKVKARAAIAKARKTRVQRLLAKRIKQIAVKPITPQAQRTLSNLIQTAVSPKVPKVVRAAAKREVKKIVARPASVRAAAINRLPTRAKVALAKAVIKAEKTTKVTADQAAKALQLWTKQGGNQGTKYNRSATVRKHQLAMGFSAKEADGIIGPKTRTRAKQLGYPLYSRKYQKPGAVGACYLGYLPGQR